MSPPLLSNARTEDAYAPNRERIYALIVERPGIAFIDIVHATMLAFGTVQYHLYVLRRLGAITTHRVGRYVRHYAVGSMTDAEREAHAAAQDPSLATAMAHANASQGELARVLGVSRQAAAYHRKRLSALTEGVA